MQVDLKAMSRKDLEKLLRDVKKALTNAQARDQKEAKKAAEKAAAEFGFSLDQLSGNAPAPAKAKKTKAKKPSVKSKPVFANPSDAKQTWTGKGRQPNWYRTEIEKGTSADALRI